MFVFSLNHWLRFAGKLFGTNTHTEIKIASNKKCGHKQACTVFKLGDGCARLKAQFSS
jgi:hypothetical protein